MRYESLETDLAGRPRSGPWLPLLASIGLHAVVLLLLAGTVLERRAQVLPATEPLLLNVRLTSSIPYRQLSGPEEFPPDSLSPAQPQALVLNAEASAGQRSTPAEADNEEQPAVPGAIVGTTIAEHNEPVSAPVPEFDNVAINGSASALAEVPALPGGVDEAGLDQTRLRTAIGSFAEGQRRTLTGQWLEDCQLQRREQGSRDCSPGTDSVVAEGLRTGREVAAGAFAHITRPHQHARLTDTFQTRMTQLRPLIAGIGPLAELARTRYYLDRENSEYLNGNYNYTMWSFVQAYQANNPNLSSLPGQGQFVCKKTPCIYEYTGFEVKGVQPAREAAVDAFQPMPGLFGRRQ